MYGKHTHVPQWKYQNNASTHLKFSHCGNSEVVVLRLFNLSVNQCCVHCWKSESPGVNQLTRCLDNALWKILAQVRDAVFVKFRKGLDICRLRMLIYIVLDIYLKTTRPTCAHKMHIPFRLTYVVRINWNFCYVSVVVLASFSCTVTFVFFFVGLHTVAVCLRTAVCCFSLSVSFFAATLQNKVDIYTFPTSTHAPLV